MTSPEKLATPETVRKALQRAYSLGQTYWQQADSESFSQNRKADETAAKFQALVEETVACVLATQRQGEGDNRKIAQLIIDNDRAGAVKWATGLIGNFDGPSCRIDPDATSQGVAVAQPDAPPAIKNKGVAFRDWETHPLYKSATAMGHFDAGWMRCLAATTSKD